MNRDEGIDDFDRSVAASAPLEFAIGVAVLLDPLLARVLNAVYGIAIPTPPRTDLLPLVTYAPPIAAPAPKLPP